MIWFLYTLQNDHYSKSGYHLSHTELQIFFFYFPLVIRTFKICFLDSLQICTTILLTIITVCTFYSHEFFFFFTLVHFIFFLIYFIEVVLVYSVLLVSGIQQSDLVTHIYNSLHLLIPGSQPIPPPAYYFLIYFKI